MKEVTSLQILQIFLTKKMPNLNGYTSEFLKIFKEDNIPVLNKRFQEIEEGIIPNLFFEVSITLTPKSQENYKPIFIRSTDTKVLNKILAIGIQ